MSLYCRPHFAAGFAFIFLPYAFPRAKETIWKSGLVRPSDKSWSPEEVLQAAWPLWTTQRPSPSSCRFPGDRSSQSQRLLTLVERIFSVKLAVFMETQAVFIKEQRTTSSPVTQGVECLANVFKHGTGKAEEEQLLRSLFLFGAVAAFAPLEPRFLHEAEKQFVGTPRVPFVFTHVTRMVRGSGGRGREDYCLPPFRGGNWGPKG